MDEVTPIAGSKTEVALHVCPQCDSHLAQPTCWEQTPTEGEWKLWRRCPECEWRGEGVYGEQVIDDYDERLDFGTRELASELRTFERANMRSFLESFSKALQADLIGPDDF